MIRSAISPRFATSSLVSRRVIDWPSLAHTRISPQGAPAQLQLERASVNSRIMRAVPRPRPSMASLFRRFHARPDFQALARPHHHRIRQHLVHPDDDEHQPDSFRRGLRGEIAAWPAPGERPAGARDRGRHERQGREREPRSRTSSTNRCGIPGRPSPATRCTRRPPCSKSRRRRAKRDRGVIYVETRGLNQRGETIMIAAAQGAGAAPPG